MNESPMGYIIAALIGVAVGIGIAFPLIDVIEKIEKKETVSVERLKDSKNGSPTETLLWAGYGAWNGNPYRTIIQLYPDSEQRSRDQIEKFNAKNLIEDDIRRYKMVEIYIRRVE